ncbi:MAG: ABC transporter transmembrane domain-containing protein [Ardenticatenaceae bacterium]|nr:ABC transporter transmembrane domain-containing protein [Ardenticatenaceae bacterium]
MRDFQRLLGFVFPYRRRLALALVAMFLGTALTLAVPMAIRVLVDSAFGVHDAARLNQATLGIFALFLVRALVTMIENYHLTIVSERVVADLRHQVYDHLVGLSLRFFANRRLGEITSRVTSDIVTMQGAVTGQIANVLRDAMTLVGALGLIIAMNWRLAGVLLTVVPLVILTSRLAGRLLRRFSREVQDRLADATAVLEETLSNIRVVKSFAHEEFERERYGQAVERAFAATRRKARTSALFSPLISALFVSSFSAVLWIGGREVLAGRLTAGELIAFLFYALTLAGAVSGLAGAYGAFQNALGASERVFEILDTLPDIADEPDARPLPPITGRVRFENVHFCYEDGRAVLDAIDLDVAPGEVVAFVGPSGAGKTTLLNLIPRFYDPAVGQVTIDGRDVRTVTGKSLRGQIGIVPQETMLFSTTAGENIRYGRLDATKAEVEAAAQAAYAHEFIMALPAGYDTLVGEKGVKLSTGQRQRIAIARALLKNPAILLLDEATAALDNESEHFVQAALQRLMQGRTVFVIAHRLSTVRNADRIIVLDQGHIVEQGSHETLLAREGLYRRLYALQFRAPESAGLAESEPAPEARAAETVPFGLPKLARR